jgi:hypothetical protein
MRNQVPHPHKVTGKFVVLYRLSFMVLDRQEDKRKKRLILELICGRAFSLFLFFISAHPLQKLCCPRNITLLQSRQQVAVSRDPNVVSSQQEEDDIAKGMLQ